MMLYLVDNAFGQTVKVSVRRQTYIPVRDKGITITPMPIRMPRVTLVPACSGVPSQPGRKAMSRIKPT